MNCFENENLTLKVLNYIEQDKECNHVSERLFYNIIESNKYFKTGKYKCLFIDCTNIHKVDVILSSNNSITHIFIDSEVLSSEYIEEVIFSLPSNIEFLNISNNLHNLESKSLKKRLKEFREISKEFKY